MSARTSGREIRVGLVVVVALAALMALLAMAGAGRGSCPTVARSTSTSRTARASGPAVRSGSPASSRAGSSA
jgi:hypothetical protein